MRFVVPQFIDVEDKIIGPLGVRQFIIFLVGAGFMFLTYKLFTFWIFAIMAIFILALSGIFAFAKINGQGFHYFLLSLLQTLKKPTLRVWNKQFASQQITIVPQVKREKKKEPSFKPPPTSSKLARLSLVVDTGGAYQEEEEELR